MAIDPITAITIGKGIFDIGSSIFQTAKASRQARKQARILKRQKRKQKELEDIYRNIDTSNPYLNMENTMEDLTINQKQADFERQQFQQTQANIMGNLREAAGGSGIANLAQALAQQGQIAAQKSAASIGRQEQAIQRAERAQAGQIQALERKGDVLSREMQTKQTETLLGLQMQNVAGTEERRALARQARKDSLSNLAGTALDYLVGEDADLSLGPLFPGAETIDPN